MSINNGEIIMEKIKNFVNKVYIFLKNDYKRMLINSILLVAILSLLFSFYEKKEYNLIEMYDNGEIKSYKLKSELVEDYQQMLSDLKVLSFRYGFFTVREFLPNSPQYKIFVVYFKNNEGFSLSLEPIGEQYVYVYRIGRLKPNGEYENSGNGSIVYRFDQHHKLKDMILKYLFGRVPIKIKNDE